MTAVEKEFTLTAENIDLNEIWFAMGYGRNVPDDHIAGLVREILAEAVSVAKLRYMYRIVPAQRISPKEIIMDGKKFTPNGIICSYLDGMTDACVYVATAGRELDEKIKELRKQDDILTDFIADSIGTVMAETAAAKVEQELLGNYGLSLSYSPGYCGWNICEQQIFFQMFPQYPCGIVLSDSSLMSPEKSISGFFAIGEHLQRQPYHCQICKNTRCYKRRNG